MAETKEQLSSLIFSIRNHSKGVPYNGSGPRPDGSENHGFKQLKGNIEGIATVPEAQITKLLEMHSSR
jgi:hypothetical protein